MCFKNLELHDKNTLLLVLPCPWVDHLREWVNWSVFHEMEMGLGSLYPMSGATNSSPLKPRNKTNFLSLTRSSLPDWSVEDGVTFSFMWDQSGNILSEVEEGDKHRTRKQKNYYRKIIT